MLNLFKTNVPILKKPAECLVNQINRMLLAENGLTVFQKSSFSFKKNQNISSSKQQQQKHYITR